MISCHLVKSSEVEVTSSCTGTGAAVWLTRCASWEVSSRQLAH